MEKVTLPPNKTILLTRESPVDLGAWDYWKARHSWPSALFSGRCENWARKKYMVFYLTYCKIHDLYFITYPSGYQGAFNCPVCLVNPIAENKQKSKG